MNQQSNQTLNTCSHPANDLIEAVAFGFATDEERDLVVSHIRECDECTQALRDAQFAAEALPLAAPDTDFDNHESIWAGIESSIASESPQEETSPAEESTLASPVTAPAAPFRVHWAVAAILALLTLAGGIFLGRVLFESDSGEDQLVAQVQVTDPEIAATGTVEYDNDDGVLVLRMDDMPAAPEGFVYQVWVITGETPVSVGTMDPNSTEFATSRNPSDYQTLAITLEEGPIGNDQPTTDPIVVADLTQLIDD